MKKFTCCLTHMTSKDAEYLASDKVEFMYVVLLIVFIGQATVI